MASSRINWCISLRHKKKYKFRGFRSGKYPFCSATDATQDLENLELSILYILNPIHRDPI